MKKYRLFIVPHAHWDKEWYFTKKDSDVLLQNNMNKLIKVLESNSYFKNFVYDGQSSIVEDYLFYQPEKKQSIEKLISQKKLLVGPWYSQPDFFNTSSESIVRNLLCGIGIAQKLGYSMETAYVPDSFGHNPGLPQVYKGFGLDQFIYWRGVKNKQLNKSTLHYWKGADGSVIKAYNFLFGYWVMGMHFDYENLTKDNAAIVAQTFLDKFNDIKSKLIECNQNSEGNILIPLGGDQAPVNGYINYFIDELNHLDPDCEWIMSSYDEYFENVKAITNLHTIEGELKYPENARIHKTIGSQRYDIKQLSKQTENNLYGILEPLAVMWQWMGGDYPRATITKALHWMLECHAHDSLGGCNTDATNRAVYQRLSDAKQVINSEINRILRSWAHNQKLNEHDLLVVNTGALRHNFWKQVTIFTKKPQLMICENQQQLPFFPISQQFINGGMVVDATAQGEVANNLEGYYKTTGYLCIPEMAPHSFKVLEIKHNGNNSAVTEIVKGEALQFENATWSISYNKGNNTFNVLYKPNQQFFTNQFQLVADIDEGDSYDYSPPHSGMQIISELSACSGILSQSHGAGRFCVDSSYIVRGSELQKIGMELFVPENGPLSIKINLTNQCQNIRWRLICETNITSDYSYANQTYCEVQRPVVIPEIKVWQTEHWDEKPVAIETNESYVYLKGNNTKIGMITKGCNEYEIIGQTHSQIALTLFRSVDYLGKHELAYRPGRASGTADYLIPTEDSKLLKPLEFKTHFFIGGNDFDPLQLAESLNTGLVYYQNQTLNKYLWRFERFLIPETFETTTPKTQQFHLINNPHITIKTLKPAENNEHEWVLRMYNNSSVTQTISFLNNMREVMLTDLLENPISNQYIKELVIEPRKIATVRFKYEKSVF